MFLVPALLKLDKRNFCALAMTMPQDSLKTEYFDYAERAGRLKDAVFTQFGELLFQNRVTLGVPMECRVKSWASIEEKISRKTLELEHITDLDDLIGIRSILLFRSDLSRVDKLVKKTFEVIQSEDTSTRLGDAQFGYQSQHYIIHLPKTWLNLPSMSDLGNLRVEIQVRTLAQHIWAAASHKLQYKNETSVPPPLRRSIHRVSALLETVDLEFERLLDERQKYIDTGIKEAGTDASLNVDNLALILMKTLPKKNWDDDESYSDLLSNLTTLGVNTEQDFCNLLGKHKVEIGKAEAIAVAEAGKVGSNYETNKERLERGVFYTHVGLARQALKAEFGEERVDALLKKSA